MPQTREVKGVATSVRTDEDGWTHVRYHQTDVVSFNAREVTLRTGGWFTATTKLRMNQASNEFNLGFDVYQRKGRWYVRYIDNSGVLYFSGHSVTIARRPMRWDGERWRAA